MSSSGTPQSGVGRGRALYRGTCPGKDRPAPFQEAQADIAGPRAQKTYRRADEARKMEPGADIQTAGQGWGKVREPRNDL